MRHEAPEGDRPAARAPRRRRQGPGRLLDERRRLTIAMRRPNLINRRRSYGRPVRRSLSFCPGRVVRRRKEPPRGELSPLGLCDDGVRKPLTIGRPRHRRTSHRARYAARRKETQPSGQARVHERRSHGPPKPIKKQRNAPAFAGSAPATPPSENPRFRHHRVQNTTDQYKAWRPAWTADLVVRPPTETCHRRESGSPGCVDHGCDDPL